MDLVVPLNAEIFLRELPTILRQADDSHKAMQATSSKMSGTIDISK